MIRVAFLMAHMDFSWLGGVNYIRNLVAAVHCTPDRALEPVLLVPPGVPAEILQHFSGTEVICSKVLAPRRMQLLARKAWRFTTGVDKPLEALLRSNGIRVISHSWHLDRSPDIAAVEWIPDFQHRHLPAFFSAEESNARDKAYRKTAQRCAALILSSQDALNDLTSFYPPAAKKSHVLHFCPAFEPQQAAPETEALRQKYGISGPYFHLPNQFWAHKNHRVVIDSLALLKAQGRPTLVVCTGHTNDSRRPGYFPELMRHAETAGVADSFRVLGLVPYADMHGLMQGAIAIVNPSLFEGWSSTVEEAKALGKALILSDLAVHREQAPRRAAYFPADTPEVLAQCLTEHLQAHDTAIEAKERTLAHELHRQAFLHFSTRYQDIVVGAINS